MFFLLLLLILLSLVFCLYLRLFFCNKIYLSLNEGLITFAYLFFSLSRSVAFTFIFSLSQYVSPYSICFFLLYSHRYSSICIEIPQFGLSFLKVKSLSKYPVLFSLLFIFIFEGKKMFFSSKSYTDQKSISYQIFTRIWIVKWPMAGHAITIWWDWKWVGIKTGKQKPPENLYCSRFHFLCARHFFYVYLCVWYQFGFAFVFLRPDFQSDGEMEKKNRNEEKM